MLKGPSGPECSSAQDLDLLLLSSLRTVVGETSGALLLFHFGATKVSSFVV